MVDTSEPIDAAALGSAMLESVPFAATLGIEFVGPDTALLRDRLDLHNHVGGPHAGALFALGESASGAVVLGAFADQLDRATPLAVRADIAYAKLARGDVTATAALGTTRAEVIAALDAGGRPEFPVRVEIRRSDGAVTATMTVVWTLRLNVAAQPTRRAGADLDGQM
jgi:acyl-coenzyme A thioesterase PaaI-like protein